MTVDQARLTLLKYYNPDSDLFRLLWLHSSQVAELSVAIARRLDEPVDVDFVAAAAILHDVGIFRCHAPSILCTGSEPYIRHGVIGAELMRAEGLDSFARVCERHTGAGLTAAEIAAQGLPLPLVDLVPESVEEQIVCYADKFFSKSRITEYTTLDRARASLSKFGDATLVRFNELIQLFGEPDFSRLESQQP